MDLAELSQRAAEGKPLYGTSTQPEWVQGVAYRNSAWSQLKFRKRPSYIHWSSPAKSTHFTDAFPMYEPMVLACLIPDSQPLS